jgi:hypothetical protein
LHQIRLCALATQSARGMHETFAQWRAQGTPGACCTRGLVCKDAQRNAHEHTGTVGAFRRSLRNGFTAYSALSPATNSSCHRRRRIGGSAEPGWARNTSADLTPATGARTTRFCRTQPPVFANRLRPKPDFGGSRKALRALAPFVWCAPIAHGKPPCDPRRARRCRVHRIPSQRS